MKERILNNWTVMRVLYVIIGLYIIAEAINTGQWFGIVFGTYFAAMGVFAFGCAAGNCYGGNCATQPITKPKQSLEEVDFEEIKNQ